VSPEAGSGRHLPAEHAGQRRLIDLDHQPIHTRQAAAYVPNVVAQALGERLGELAAGTVVGQDPVAAGSLDRGGQRPWPGDLHLESADVTFGRLLERVEVLREQAARPPLIDPGRVGEPPAGRLQVGAELGHEGKRPPGHRRGGAAAGHLGQVRQVR
jgi:hypothetical protein